MYRRSRRSEQRGSDVAEGAMVKEQLAPAPMIDAGAELTRKLDESGLPVTTALWLFVSELNEWRLLFASPEVDTKGPRDVYEKIRAGNQPAWREGVSRAAVRCRSAGCKR